MPETAEGARVFIAEDDPLFVQEITKHLAAAGHTVALVAATLEAALAAIPRLEEEEINAIILGGNLGDWRLPKDPYHDSQVILRKLKEAGLAAIPTIGFSGNEIPGTTVDVGRLAGGEALAQAVSLVISRK